MTPKKPSSPEEVIEAIRVLSGTVEHANSYLEMIADSLDQIRSEIRWILDNREDVFPLVVKAMPLDPCDPRWEEKLAKLNEDARQAPQKPEETPSIRCDVCEKETTVEKARETGWTGIGRWKDGERPYLGICPGCSESPKDVPAAKSVEHAKPSTPKKTTLF